MIRLGKPVQLFEWGLGTNTMNQRWEMVAEGNLHNKAKTKSGATTLVVEVNDQFERKNEGQDAIKVMQQGEGMTPTPGKWGEVAMGKLKAVEKSGTKTIVYIELSGAAKLG